MIYEMGDTLNYKAWAIRVEIKKLRALIKHLPDSPETESRKQRLEALKADLENLE